MRGEIKAMKAEYPDEKRVKSGKTVKTVEGFFALVRTPD